MTAYRRRSAGPVGEDTVYEYSDRDSLDGRSDVSDDRPSPADWLMNAPVFRLNKEDGQQPVYEAWVVRCPIDDAGGSFRTFPLGKALSTYADFGGAEAKPVDYDQSSLAQMHVKALEEFHKNRRGWSSRVFGKRKTYEQDIDERCRNLPLAIQEGIFRLMETRGRVSSTCYRTRKWTVVLMSARTRHRFAEADHDQIKRHKFRFWKNKATEAAELLDYLFVIRGTETKTCTERKQIARFDKFENPWVHVDREECRRKVQEERAGWAAQRRKQCQSPPRYRCRRDYSPASEREPTGRWLPPRTGIPHRVHSPTPYQEQETSRARSLSRPPYRCRRDYSPISDDGTYDRGYAAVRRESLRRVPPTVPMPPDSAPPPAISRYTERYWAEPSPPQSPPPDHLRGSFAYDSAPFHRPRVTYEEDDGWDDIRNPTPRSLRPNVSVYRPQFFGIREPEGVDAQPVGQYVDWQYFPNCVAADTCAACRESPSCDHFGHSDVCERPVRRCGQTIAHPPCFLCMATNVDNFPIPTPFGTGPLPMATENGPLPASRPSVHVESPFPGPPPYRVNEQWNDGYFEDGAGGETDIESDDGQSLQDTVVDSIVAGNPDQGQEGQVDVAIRPKDIE